MNCEEKIVIFFCVNPGFERFERGYSRGVGVLESSPCMAHKARRTMKDAEIINHKGAYITIEEM